MTPEDKAKQLVDRFRPYIWHRIHIRSEEQEDSYASSCALICCDEIIEEIEDLQQNCAIEFPMALEYWKKVKEEIKISTHEDPRAE